MTRRFGIALTFGVLCSAVSVLAHHSAAPTYDTDQKITLHGTITKLEWKNPHVFYYIDVTDAAGKVTNWAVESGNPTDMSKRGWARTSFKPGTEVTVTLQPSKSGQPVGRIMAVTLATGQTFK